MPPLLNTPYAPERGIFSTKDGTGVIDTMRWHGKNQPARCLRVEHDIDKKGVDFGVDNYTAGTEMPVGVATGRQKARGHKVKNGRHERQLRNIDMNGHIRSLGHLQQVPAQPEASDIGCGRKPEFTDDSPTGTVQHGPPTPKFTLMSLIAIPPGLDCRCQNATTERLGKQKDVARAKPGIGCITVWVDDAGDRKTILDGIVLYAMPAHKNRPGFTHLVRTTPKDISQNILWQFLHRKTDDVERTPRFTPHRVDIGKSISSGYLPEQIRIVDDRREEIEGLHDRLTAGDPDYRGVLVVSRTDDHPLPFPGVAGKCGKNTLQVPWRNLCCSTGGA